MTVPYIPDDQFHLQHPPEKWQQINQQATADYHRDLAQGRVNHEALQAIKDSNDALNAYEAPAIIAGEHTLKSGWGNPVSAVKGEAQGAVDALLAPFHLANTAYRKGPGAAIDEIIGGIKALPGEITSGDPERIGEVAGNVAGSIAAGKLGAKLARGAGSSISNLVERPALKNALLKAQTQQALHGVAKTGATLDDAIEQAGLKTDTMKQNLAHKAELHPDKVEQAGLQTNKLHQDVAQKAGTIKPTVDQANLKTDIMKQQLEKGNIDITKGKGTVDEIIRRAGLQNDLTELQIERLKRALEGDEGGEAGPSGSAPLGPKAPTEGPNDILDPKSNAMKDFIANTDPYGLNDLTPKPETPPKPDALGNWINDLRTQHKVGESAPHDILGPDLNLGPKPLTPEQINQLLNDVPKPKRPPKGPDYPPLPPIDF